MIMSMDSEFLYSYAEKIKDHFFPDNKKIKLSKKTFTKSVERLDECFTSIKKKYYYEDGKPIFNHLNSDQFCTFLYFLSNQSFIDGCIENAEKYFYLNKILHGLDLFYSVELPDIFLFVHPVGTVIGNAKFNDFCVFYQNVTIGSDIDGIYPNFLGSTIFFSGCSVIGDCKFGNNTIIGARSFILKEDVPSDSIVTGSSNLNLKVSPSNRVITKDFFNINS